MHRHGHQNGQQSWSIFLSSFCLLLLWRPLGQYRASSHPMAASSSLRSSPGHAALGNAICIAPAHVEGLQNGLQWRCILMSSSILSSIITVAKITCYSQCKLKTICRHIYYNLISLIVYYGLPPTTMVAVLATIVAGG